MIFTFLIPLILLLSIGLLVLSIAGNLQNRSLLYQLAYAYGIGIGCITLQMMLYSFLHISWSIVSLLLPWICVFIISVLQRLSFRATERSRGISLLGHNYKGKLCNYLQAMRSLHFAVATVGKTVRNITLDFIESIVFLGIVLTIGFVIFESLLRPLTAF